MKKKSEPIKTVLVISIGFLLIFIITSWEWSLASAFIIGLAGILSDFLAIKIDFLWLKLTYILSLIIPNILLGAVFYLFLFPIALISRLFGKRDPLILKNKSGSIYKEISLEFEKKHFKNPW